MPKQPKKEDDQEPAQNIPISTNLSELLIMPATRSSRSQNLKPYGRKALKSSRSQTTPFEDAVPSLAVMKAIPTQASITVSNDSGESERFKPNDR